MFPRVDDLPTGDIDTLFLSGSHDQNINLWRLSSDAGMFSVTLLHVYKGHARSVEAIALSPDETKVCTCTACELSESGPLY